jgi:hypothetical protein
MLASSRVGARTGGAATSSPQRRRASSFAAAAAPQRLRRPSARAAAAAAGGPGGNNNSNNNNNNNTPPSPSDVLTALARAPLALAEAATGGRADPVLRAAAREPAAFFGGAFAALLQLDESRDPLREWIERTREAAGLDPEVPTTTGDDEEF